MHQWTGEADSWSGQKVFENCERKTFEFISMVSKLLGGIHLSSKDFKVGTT